MPKLRIIGVAAAVAAYPFILVSIALSPWFEIYNNALSDLGNTATNGLVGYLYNSGLILAGALVFIFAVLLLKATPRLKLIVWTIP